MSLGINYEGGKIIETIESDKLCIYAVNIQIAMDAPFHGSPADDKTRTTTPTEQTLPGYNEEDMISSLCHIYKELARISIEQNVAKIVIQIARGKSWLAFWQLLERLFKQIHDNIIVVHGYRSTDYYKSNGDPFIFMNIGMFARLDETLQPGNVCVPIRTIDIDNNKSKVKERTHRVPSFLDPYPKIQLIGITDDMPFVTPDNYTLEGLLKIF